jgi:hypothetical protein
MIVGADFDKIEFSLFGLDLLEPNALISDSLIMITCLVIYLLLRKKVPSTAPFYQYWKWLFILQGAGFFLGGLAHTLYNYTGVIGKYFPLAIGIGFAMMIEHAMISLLDKKQQKSLLLLSKVKAGIALIILTTLMFTIDVENNLMTLLLVPSLNTTIGYISTLGVIGWIKAKVTSRDLYLLPLSVLTLIPAAIVQSKKISFHPWFDRNDFSHLLIIAALIMYYFAIIGYRKFELKLAEQNH